VASELLSAAKAPTERPWVLFVGENEEALDAAARSAIDWSLPVISPPDRPMLPLAMEELPAPPVEGERILYAPSIERGFFDTPLSAASALYLLPRLTQVASGGEPLTFVATAVESELNARAESVLAQRGLASRFEIRRVEGEPDRSREAAPTWEDLVRAAQSAGESAIALVLRSTSLENLRRAIEADPDLPCARYELGKALIRADDIEGAAAQFRKAAELLPEYASAWGNLGAALGELKDYEGAASALSRAVALDPENAPLHSNLGAACRDQGRLREAEEHFRRAIAIDPAFVFGHYNLAHTLFLEEQYREAIETFEKAQSMDRGRAPRQALLLACARLAAGDVEGALRDYRSVLESLPETSRREHRAVAEWDLKQLAQKTGPTPALRETARLLRTI
jgi:tetratricopeptide (TPR) repeat protein